MNYLSHMCSLLKLRKPFFRGRLHAWLFKWLFTFGHHFSSHHEVFYGFFFKIFFKVQWFWFTQNFLNCPYFKVPFLFTTASRNLEMIIAIATYIRYEIFVCTRKISRNSFLPQDIHISQNFCAITFVIFMHMQLCICASKCLGQNTFVQNFQLHIWCNVHNM